MAYSTPTRFSHGDQTVSAANFNVFSDDLTVLKAALVGENWAVGDTATGVALSFVNLWRWLWYKARPSTTVVLSDPSGTGSDVTLGSDSSQMVAYDLANVSWLTPGQVYIVTGAQFAAEDSTN